MDKKQELTKKKIIYRSSRKGIKELDILLGNYVKNNINSLTKKNIEQIEKILTYPGQEIIKQIYHNNSCLDQFSKNLMKKIVKNHNANR